MEPPISNRWRSETDPEALFQVHGGGGGGWGAFTKYVAYDVNCVSDSVEESFRLNKSDRLWLQ